MKTIIMFLVGLFTFSSVIFANHIFNDDIVIFENWDWEVLLKNPNLENEKVLLMKVIIAAENFIKIEGVEKIVSNIIESPPRTHVFSKTAFLAIIKNDCKLIFHAALGDLRNGSMNICRVKSTHPFAEKMRKVVEGKITEIVYQMHQGRTIQTNRGPIKVRYIHYMVGYAYKKGEYTLFFTTVIRVDLGFPIQRIKMNQRFVTNDTIQRIKV